MKLCKIGIHKWVESSYYRTEDRGPKIIRGIFVLTGASVTSGLLSIPTHNGWAAMTFLLGVVVTLGSLWALVEEPSIEKYQWHDYICHHCHRVKLDAQKYELREALAEKQSQLEYEEKEEAREILARRVKMFQRAIDEIEE